MIVFGTPLINYNRRKGGRTVASLCGAASRIYSIQHVDIVKFPSSYFLC